MKKTPRSSGSCGREGPERIRQRDMCCRYYLETKEDPVWAEAAEKAEALANKYGVKMRAAGDIAIGTATVVLAPSRLKREVIVFPMIWGFPHPKKKDILVFNTRSETAEEKDLFCTSVEDRRCAVPVTAYYEWKKGPDGKKERVTFTPDRRCFLAGLYIRQSGVAVPSFSILTCEAADNIKAYHPRMPVLVPEERLSDWLNGDLPVKEAAALCRDVKVIPGVPRTPLF